MARYAVQVIGHQVLIEHKSADLAELREELVRTRHLMGVVLDGDAHTAAEVLISTNAIRWICKLND